MSLSQLLGVPEFVAAELFLSELKTTFTFLVEVECDKLSNLRKTLVFYPSYSILIKKTLTLSEIKTPLGVSFFKFSL